MHALATALISVVLALGALGLAVAAPHAGDREEPRAALAAASGAVQISNSRAGQAVFSAGAMRPGQGVSGTLRIGNSGDVAGRFSVKPSGVQDTPGPYGGRLSERVQLVLFDVTNVYQPATMYAGTPAGFDAVELGTIAPGGHRDYLFAATLPDGGSPSAAAAGDNRFQGSALSLGFEWLAGPAGSAPVPAPDPILTPTSPPPEPDPILTPTSPPPAIPDPAPAPEPTGEELADALGLPPAGACVRRRRLSLRFAAPGGARVLSVTVAVNGKVQARVNGARTRKPVELRGLPKRPITLLVSVRASNGRSYESTRSYRSCTTKKSAGKTKRR